MREEYTRRECQVHAKQPAVFFFFLLSTFPFDRSAIFHRIIDNRKIFSNKKAPLIFQAYLSCSEVTLINSVHCNVDKYNDRKFQRILEWNRYDFFFPGTVKRYSDGVEDILILS